MRVWWDQMPETVAAEIAKERLQLERLRAPEAPIDAAHLFVAKRDVLETKLCELLPRIDRAAFIWVSWPKKASKVPTDISEGVVRQLALPMHLVDVKVCSIDDIWSGLKLVIRREHR